METDYHKRYDMGSWAGGTSPAIKKKMEKRVRELRREVGETIESEPDEKVQVRVNARKGKAVNAPKPSKRRHPRVAGTDAGEISGTDSRSNGPSPPLILPEEQTDSSYTDGDSEESTINPTAKRATKTVMNVVIPPRQESQQAAITMLPSGTTPATGKNVQRNLFRNVQSNLYRFFSKKDGESTEVVETPAAKGKTIASSSDQVTDDSSAVQLKAEAAPGRSKKVQMTGQKRRHSFERLTSGDEDDLLASGSSTIPSKSSQTPAAAHVSTKPKSSAKKRRTLRPPEPIEYEVERVLDHRVRDGNKEYLVKWAGYPSSENTYSPPLSLPSHFATLIFFPVGSQPKTLWVARTLSMNTNRPLTIYDGISCAFVPFPPHGV
ncbi:hypothetical protein FN846DRAFT_717217 [Sphaerosporella brunnea]|uniref:Chromo domain-containing protein n=1 Tax=Sphaerosporella brunnea TaxID=1250544 RepID=A0A5J5EWT2_9PEZI|nr:hypothetical protein FN846DRAFT_717217 [Sphaerosporella brunnea]